MARNLVKVKQTKEFIQKHCYLCFPDSLGFNGSNVKIEVAPKLESNNFEVVPKLENIKK